MKRRILAIVLSLCMIFTLTPCVAMAAPATDFTDTDGHWAEDAIDRWAGYGIIEGYEGVFDPNGDLTRAQLAAIIARLLNLPEAAKADFTDVDGHWAEDVINRCAEAGIMLGSDGKARPDDKVSREETMVMLGRALGIKPVESTSLNDYPDSANVSSWAKGYVAALTENNIVNGIAGELKPEAEIDRASTVTILHRAISAYANESGQTVEAEGSGIVLVAAEDVTVTGSADSVVVAQGAAGGTTTIEDANIAGEVTVTAGDANVVLSGETKATSVEVTEAASGTKVEVSEKATVETVATKAENTEVAVSGTVSKVEVTETAAGAKVDVAETAKVETVAAKAENTEVAVSGTVSKVEVTETAAGAKVEVSENATVETVATKAENTEVAVSGTVSKVEVSDSAANTKVEAAAGSTITNVENKAEGTTVKGEGKVENVTTSGNNTTVDTNGTKVEAAEGTTGTTAGGNKVEGGSTSTTTPSTPSTPSTGGSSSGSTPDPEPTPDTTIDTAEELIAAVAAGGTVELGGNVTLTTSQAVTLSSGTATLNLNGYSITADGDAIVVETGATLTINGEGNVKGGQSGIGSWCAVWANGGDVVINGGTYNVGGDSNTAGTHQNDCIYAKLDAEITINGGTFGNESSNIWVLNAKDNNGTIIVKGGTFYGQNPTDTKSEPTNPNSFVAPGYEATESPVGVWTVSAFEGILQVSDNEYEIYGKDGMYEFANMVNVGGINFAGKTVTLMADINLNNEEWTPIASTEEKSFHGIFDGNNKTISNLKVTGTDALGLFGWLKDAANNSIEEGVVKNIKIENVNINGERYLGSVVAVARGSKVENCTVSGIVKIEGNYQTGGVVGQAYTNIYGCTVNGDANSYVKATYQKANYEGDNAGGIVGFFGEANYTLSDCNASIDVEGTRKVGGIVGYIGHTGMVVEGCVFSGTVTCNADITYATDNAGKLFIAGIVGESGTKNGNDNKITNCTVTAGSIITGIEQNNTGAVLGGGRNATGTTTLTGCIYDDVTVNIRSAE